MAGHACIAFPYCIDTVVVGFHLFQRGIHQETARQAGFVVGMSIGLLSLGTFDAAIVYLSYNRLLVPPRERDVGRMRLATFVACIGGALLVVIGFVAVQRNRALLRSQSAAEATSSVGITMPRDLLDSGAARQAVEFAGFEMQLPTNFRPRKIAQPGPPGAVFFWHGPSNGPSESGMKVEIMMRPNSIGDEQAFLRETAPSTLAGLKQNSRRFRSQTTLVDVNGMPASRTGFSNVSVSGLTSEGVTYLVLGQSHVISITAMDFGPNAFQSLATLESCARSLREIETHDDPPPVTPRASNDRDNPFRALPSPAPKLPITNADTITQALADLAQGSEAPSLISAARSLQKMAPNERRGEVAEALGRHLRHPNVAVQTAVLEALEQWHSPEQIPVLIDALDDDNPFVRRHLIAILANYSDARVVEALAGRLAEFLDRRAATEALIEIGARAEPAVLEQLNHPDAQVRQSACEVLGRIGTQKSLAPLKRKLRDPDIMVRRTVQEAGNRILQRTGARSP